MNGSPLFPWQHFSWQHFPWQHFSWQRYVSTLLLIGIFSTTVVLGQASTVELSKNLAPQIKWPTFNEAFEAAKESKKIVLIDVWSSTCSWCRKQQTEVYTQPDLQAFLFENFELGRLDLDITDDTLSFRGYTLSSQMLAGGLGATGTPTTVFMETDRGYITRLQGFHAYQDFFDVLRFIGTESFRDMSFEEFMADKKQ